MPPLVKSAVEQMLDMNNSTLALNGSKYADFFPESPGQLESYLLLKLFETGDDTTYFALVQLEQPSFFVDLALLDSKNREVENFFGRALVDLCDLIFR